MITLIQWIWRVNELCKNKVISQELRSEISLAEILNVHVFD